MAPENVPMYPYEIASRLSSLKLLDNLAQTVPDSSYDDLDPLERDRLKNIIIPVKKSSLHWYYPKRGAFLVFF